MTNTDENMLAMHWWMGLSREQQIAVYKQSDFSHWSFSIFKLKTWAIRNVWLKQAAIIEKDKQ